MAFFAKKASDLDMIAIHNKAAPPASSTT